LKKLNTTKSLKEIMAWSWVISGSLAVLTCALVFLGFAWVDYKNTKTRLEDDLVVKSETVARRLSGEILLGKSGAVDSVSTGLEKELGLKQIKLLDQSACEAELCTNRNGNTLSVIRKIPHVESKVSVEITTLAPPFFTLRRFSLFLLCVLPIALVLGIALVLQKSFISKYVINPISSLVETSTGAEAPSQDWPVEIKNISKRLSTSFEEREQSIYGQMARGVIHDIRTLLHPVMSASSLVAEEEGNPQKRQVCLETLQKASETNLSKMSELINLTLDGSREIPVTPKRANIIEVIKNALKTNEALIHSKNVSIVLRNAANEIVVAHDPVQMERVFTNLIKNAIEACAEKKYGKKEVLISFENKANSYHVSISVEDSGVGLPSEPSKVFRLLKSTKLHGTGLGLMVSKKIVEAHGGSLVPSRSASLNGARFEVLLPC